MVSEELFIGVQTLMNESLFGSPQCPSNWKFPVQDDGTMGVIKFANWRARRVIENIDGFVDIAQPEEERQRWKDVFHLYREMMKVCCFLLLEN